MLNVRFNLSYVVVFALISGLVFILGCGNSPEKQKMSDFLQEFSQTVSEFAAADQGKKSPPRFWIRWMVSTKKSPKNIKTWRENHRIYLFAPAAWAEGRQVVVRKTTSDR
jgi:hypothetical protein